MMIRLETALLVARDVIMERNPGKTESECLEQFALASAIIEALRERDRKVRFKLDKNLFVPDDATR